MIQNKVESMVNICMIGGSGRCGTTVLRTIFSFHPDVAIVPEWRFLTDPDGLIDFYTGYPNWSPYHVNLRINRLEKLLNDLSGNRKARRFFRILQRSSDLIHFPLYLTPRYHTIHARPYCPRFAEFSSILINQLSSFGYSGHWTGMRFLSKNRIRYHMPLREKALKEIIQDFLYKIFQNVLEEQKANHYLEKNPWFILAFNHILDLLPKAKLLHIYRDPRDVVTSYTRQIWMPSDPEKCAFIYRDIMNRWRQIRDTIPKKSYLEISLESLVDAPETILNRICEFWNIPWHDALLKTDLSKSNTGCWRKHLNFREQDTISQILKEELAELGYE
jgi:hypothetical protein